MNAMRMIEWETEIAIFYLLYYFNLKKYKQSKLKQPKNLELENK